MLFSYQAEGQEYIVQGEAPAEGATEVEVSFIARVNGGRGRMPKARAIALDKLQVLVSVDIEKAKDLVKPTEE